MLLVNPFGTSTTIRQPEQFFGRADALDYLYSEIVSRRCVSVVGTRRIGKSSLLRCMCLPQIQKSFQGLYNLEKYLLVFIDLGEFLSKTCDDFFSAVCIQLITQSRERLTLELPQDTGGGDAFCELLDEIQNQGFHPVLLLDAFHQVASNTHFDARFFSFLRAQANHGRVSYVTASITPLDQCCHPYIEGSPFFNIFSVYRLGPLEQKEAQDLLLKLVTSVGLSFTTEETEMVLHLAGRHPFFIQRVAFCLFRTKHQSHDNHSKLKSEAYQDLLPHFKNIWEYSLNSEQREHLREVVRWKHSRQKKVPELSESTLFRRFVREICDIQPVDISAEYLENVLNHLGDTKFLGECEITHLYLFYSRLPHSLSHHSVHDKGIIVRHILQDARDKLRPAGEPSDTAPDWQCFNVLNYRFFKFSMKNEALSDLLGISVRQLHRVRHLAIERLKDVLHEMELTAKNDLDHSHL
jgi:AAA+ ATPase superfamily predicted ATPase